ncbi:MAG: hypothetical protein V1855_03685 [bacterium]
MKKQGIIFFIICFILCPILFAQEQRNVRYQPFKSVAPQQAAVTLGNQWCPEELVALGLRKQKTHTALQQFCNQLFPEKNTPTIAIACSGGGFRAAVATLGLLQGLEKIGLLDAVTYIASISGATWTTSSWLVHNYTLDELELFLRKSMYHAFYPENLCLPALALSIISKMQDTRYISINDLWGGMLGDIFLSRIEDFGGQTTHLSDLAASTLQGKNPIPIFSAVIGESGPFYQWVEFSPFNVGSPELEVWIPSWAFGRKFNQGTSLSTGHQETLAYLLGLFGSAYAVNMSDAIKSIEETLENSFNVTLPLDCFTWVAKKVWGQKRISPPEVNNFMYQLEKKPYYNNQRLTFVDAGVAFNLPFPPLLRRNVDIYIVCDASGDIRGIINNQLKKSQEYAINNGFAFPLLNLQEITTQDCSIIIDPQNATAPVIIYAPNFTDISTLDLDYSEQDFSLVLNATRNAILNNVEKIKGAVFNTIKNSLKSI